MAFLSQEFILERKKDLLSKKEEILNSMRDSAYFLKINSLEVGGDEIDQSSRTIREQGILQEQKRLRFLLFEIELSLMKIENGLYGICEETSEYIEKERLILIPWTKLSIEGAEIRENIHSL